MLIKKRLAIGIVAFTALQASAACVLDTKSPQGGVAPTTLKIDAFTLFVDADAPVDSLLPTDQGRSNLQGIKVSFINCVIGEKYGKSTILSVSSTKNLFNTNIEGIAVKPQWSNGNGTGHYPSTSSMMEKRFNYPPESYFNLLFYKTQKRLKLSNPTGDLLLNPGIIAYNWVTSDNIINAGQKLNIGEIRIISTPVCRMDGEKSVDFKTVSATSINNGVKHPLNFSLTCATDYGSYSASAALNTQTPTADSAFIQVTDNGNHLDRLKIRVDDSNGFPLPVDGSRAEIKRAINSDLPAQFSWSATLLRASSTLLPENGPFTAKAEIVLQLN